MSSESYQPSTERYWADEEREQIASAIEHKFGRYHERLESEGRLEVWRTADLCYHGRNPDGGYANSVRITFGGDSDEVSLIHVGHFRRHVHGMHALATSQRPNIEVTAAQNDPESVASTQVGRQVLDYDLDESGLERDLRETHLRALAYAEGYLVQTWDFHRGELIAAAPIEGEVPDAPGPMGESEGAGVDDTEAIDAVADTILGAADRDGSVSSASPALAGDAMPAGEMGVADAKTPKPPREVPVRAGAVKCVVRSPLDVARDLDLDRADEQPWYIVRTRESRWELAARYPGKDPASMRKRHAILHAPAALDDRTLWDSRASSRGTESDYIHTLTLYHPPSDALPAGRLVEVVDGERLEDDPYPYDHCVVHQDIPSVELDRAVGYGDAWDMLAISQALDAVESGILTVADHASLIRWLAARGQRVDTTQLSDGLTLVEYDDDGVGRKPPGLAERPEVRPSDLKMSEHYQGHLRTLSGQNSVVQGEPDPNIGSGNFAALVASMAVQAINQQAGAYAELMRAVLTGRLKLYQTFATEPRVIEITGRDKLGHVKSFTRAALDGVRRVRVELANPILRTVQGKLQVADKLTERFPNDMTIERYFAVMATGRLDDLDPSSIVKHKVIARKENDLFREGQGQRVVALVSDHHECHIAEHLEQLNDATIRFEMFERNSTEIAATLDRIQALNAHILEHGRQWVQLTQQNPALLAATGQRPAPMPAPPMPPPGAAPSGPGGPDAPGPMPPAPPSNGGGGPAGGRVGPEPVVPGPEDATPPLVANEQQMPVNPITGDRGVPGVGTPATSI